MEVFSNLNDSVSILCFCHIFPFTSEGSKEEPHNYLAHLVIKSTGSQSNSNIYNVIDCEIHNNMHFYLSKSRRQAKSISVFLYHRNSEAQRLLMISTVSQDTDGRIRN